MLSQLKLPCDCNISIFLGQSAETAAEVVAEIEKVYEHAEMISRSLVDFPA